MSFVIFIGGELLLFLLIFCISLIIEGPNICLALLRQYFPLIAFVITVSICIFVFRFLQKHFIRWVDKKTEERIASNGIKKLCKVLSYIALIYVVSNVFGLIFGILVILGQEIPYPF